MSISEYQLEPQGQCSGSLRVPGDKSISHRAIMLAAIAEGISEISGFLSSADCLATLNAFQAMGVKIAEHDATRLCIYGMGLNGLQAPGSELNMGNSGTAMRLMAGILSGQSFASTLTGDESLSTRPMLRIQQPLQQMGAKVLLSDQNTAPIKILPTSKLNGIYYRSPIASAQVKSCVLLAGLYAQGETCVEEDTCSRDHTERMLQSFSYPVTVKNNSVCLTGRNKLIATDLNIPGDISSAAFFIVGTLISKSAELEIKGVGINSTRDGVIEILQLMGAGIEIRNKRNYGAEPVADLFIHTSDLHGVEIPRALIAKTIDEFPILFVAAACAKGTTTLRGAAELRVKESDRIHSMAVGLQTLGIVVEEKPDGLIITGGQITGGKIDSDSDHRVAMSFAIASLAANEPITIRNTENVNTSFPNFVDCASQLGLRFK